MPLALPFWRVAATFVAATRQKNLYHLHDLKNNYSMVPV